PTRIFTNPSDYSPIITFDEGTDLSLQTNILTAWQARYGILSVGNRLCLKTAVIDKSNGLRSAEVINCTTSEEVAKFVKIHTNVSQPSTAGTAATDVDTFNLPAGTLVDNGDVITCNYAGTSSSLAGTG